MARRLPVDGAEAARAKDPRPGTRRAAKTIPSLADGVAAEVEVETGFAYPDGEPVAVVVKRREHRYDLDDGGGAIARAGRPPGWEEAAERAVRRSGMNVSRATGRVFVPAVEGRDLERLASRLAEASLDVLESVVELEEPAQALGPDNA